MWVLSRNFCSFRDEAHPLNVQFELDSLEKFDVIMKDIDVMIVATKNMTKDVTVDRQHNETVNISDIIERDIRHRDPDDPAYSKP